MPPPSSPTVFVVDDDEAVRKAVSRLLRSAGIAMAAFASPGEFLEDVVASNMNKQSAADLGITAATVKMHRARVMAKMKVQSVAELARLTVRCGIKVTNLLKSAALSCWLVLTALFSC